MRREFRNQVMSGAGIPNALQCSSTDESTSWFMGDGGNTTNEGLTVHTSHSAICNRDTSQQNLHLKFNYCSLHTVSKKTSPGNIIQVTWASFLSKFSISILSSFKHRLSKLEQQNNHKSIRVSTCSTIY